MLQNRVDPLGSIIKTTARGSLMGNRGRIHNDHQQLVLPFRLQAWITCLLEFKNRKRPVMAPGQYTELFFLDEATSFAAGHRPCFECRRKDADQFKAAWLKGNAQYGFTVKTPIREIDAIMHTERITPAKQKVTFEAPPGELPNGSFVLYNDEPYLVKDGTIYLWTPFGYDTKLPLPASGYISVLTPRSVVNTLQAGYIPQMAV